jgi:hypothetical protein
MNQEILKEMPEWYRMLMKAIQDDCEDGPDCQANYQVTEKNKTGGVIR